MPRDLLVICIFATICIIISPLFKESKIKILNNTFNDNPHQKPISLLKTNFLTQKNHTIKSNNFKKIVLLCDTFLPGSFAGSEISAYETIKYLRDRGHNISVFIHKPAGKEYDGFKLYKYYENDPFCKKELITADIVLYQMADHYYNFNLIQQREKPVFIFIHVAKAYHWILTQKVSFPIVVVFNSRATQDTLPTIHDNIRMIPYVNTKPFYPLREKTIQNDIVCLINCNTTKGVTQFNEIVKKMKHIQFIGVKGGYGHQDLLNPCPPNLVYMENQTDIRIVFKKIGVLLMPSKSETWGRAAVEAMSSGVPVIHSEAEGLVECIGGAGIMCQRDDIEGWCQAIERIIGDKAYRTILRENGFRRVKEIEAEQIRGRQEFAMKIEADN